MLRFFILFLLSASVAFAQGIKRNVEYTREDSALIVKLLTEAPKARGTEHPMLYFGTRFIGVPYVAHTLEGGDSEHLIVNLHELDCTTFVETVAALTLCDAHNQRTFADYCRWLTQIRYRQGQLTDYTSRLHYFTWWGEDNEQMGFVTSVTPTPETSSVFTATQTLNINYMSTHAQSYRQLKNHPEFIPVIRSQEQASRGKSYPFIPKSKVGLPQSSALGKAVHDGDIISMLTSKPGLDTSHIGIAVWQNGRLHLLNASSLYKRVVLDTTTFYDYQQKQSSQTGIRVYRVALRTEK